MKVSHLIILVVGAFVIVGTMALCQDGEANGATKAAVNQDTPKSQDKPAEKPKSQPTEEKQDDKSSEQKQEDKTTEKTEPVAEKKPATVIDGPSAGTQELLELFDTHVYRNARKAIVQFTFGKGTTGPNRKDATRFIVYCDRWIELATESQKTCQTTLADKLAYDMSLEEARGLKRLFSLIRDKAAKSDEYELLQVRAREAFGLEHDKDVTVGSDKDTQLVAAFRLLKTHYKDHVGPMLKGMLRRLQDDESFSKSIFNWEIGDRHTSSINPNSDMDFRYLQIALNRLKAYQAVYRGLWKSHIYKLVKGGYTDYNTWYQKRGLKSELIGYDDLELSVRQARFVDRLVDSLTEYFKCESCECNTLRDNP